MDKVAESQNRWVISSLLLIILLPIVFIIGIQVGISIEGSVSLSQDNLSSWVAALSTVVIAVLTIVLAKETWSLRLIQLSQIEEIRRSSIKPSIGLYLKQNPVGFNFIDVHIENNGSGIAQNVKFKFKNVNNSASDVFESLSKKISQLVILNDGISSLSSGEKRSSFLFSFIDLHSEFGDKALECIIEVDIKFKDIEGTKYSSKSLFNFAEYKGISQLGGGDSLRKISSHLEKMQKDIGHITSGFKKIKTDVYTRKDRKIEEQEWEENIEQYQKKLTNKST